ncbi:hypothetical protein GCM10022280_22230 [Sphingomonas swuensis]|uniref:Uncharacterized protein n=1 Tax=Sphingomonas swuensis TaxID=977800 RepID=A0ABP7T564_9SPHN
MSNADKLPFVQVDQHVGSAPIADDQGHSSDAKKGPFIQKTVNDQFRPNVYIHEIAPSWLAEPSLWVEG